MRWLTLALLVVTGRSPSTRPVPREPRPAPRDEVFRLAAEILWEDGVLRSPERLTAGDALAALDVLVRTNDDDPHAAVAAFVLGPTRWREAVDRALARQAHTGVRPEPLEELDRHEQHRVLEVWDTLDTWRDRLAIAWPIERPCRVSSRFGLRMHPILRRVREHEGVDLSVPVGTPVVAAHGGEVVSATYGRGTGRALVVDDGNGLVTRYYHLDELLVARGAEVVRGQPIGRSGATGRVTGPHLHFEVELRGEPLYPLRLRPVTAPSASASAWARVSAAPRP